MPAGPSTKRAIAFVDGQNLFFAARDTFGYTYPNYDFPALAKEVCQVQGWEFKAARFYTGIPDEADNPRWNYFWAGKLLQLSRQGVDVHSRDVALVFSQDQDLRELCTEIRVIASEQDRWIKIACAFPVSPTTRNRRGIANSDWIRIDRAMYDRCVDPRDYRRKTGTP